MMGGSPAASKTGKVNSVPPPTRALDVPARKPMVTRKMISIGDTGPDANGGGQTLNMRDLWAQQRSHPRRHGPHIIERRVGVWLQRSRENTRHAVITKRAVKSFEFLRAARKIDKIYLLSGARAFQHPIHRIAHHPH